MRQPHAAAWLALIPFAMLAAPASSIADDAIRFPGCAPSFDAPRPAQGVAPNGGPGVYLGGDAGFACPIDRETTFWTICDVAIGPVGARTRKESTNKTKGLAIGNSIALTTCRDGKTSVRHFFRGSADDPHPFFPDPDNRDDTRNGTRLWPRRAFMDQGKLYVFAQQIADPGAVYNTWLIRVDNPLDSPDRWQFVYFTIGRFAIPRIKEPMPASAIHFGSEAVLSPADGYLYCYGIETPLTGWYEQKFRTTAMRIPLEALREAKPWEDLGKKAETMTAKFNVWKPGLLDRDDLWAVDIPAFNGFSVRYNATLKLWQVVYCNDREHARFYAGQIKMTDPQVNGVYVMAGKTPFGPWGKPERVGVYPEMDPARAEAPTHRYNPDFFGYFVTEVPAYEASDAEIAFTYTIASHKAAHEHDLRDFEVDMNQYKVETWTAPNPLMRTKAAAPPPPAQP